MTSPRFEVSEEDIVLQELASTEQKWAEGAALFGPFGLADNQRKIFLEKTGLEIRNSKLGANEKVTEAFLDQAAHADTEYAEYVTDMVLAKAQWLVLDQTRERLWAKLKCIQARGWDNRRVA